MGDFYHEEKRRAVKARQCHLCGEEIAAGDGYFHKAGRKDGEFWNTEECDDCQQVIQAFLGDCTSPSEGYNEDLIAEWWVEHKCVICKRRFPVCVPDASCGDGRCGPCTERTTYGTCMADVRCDKMTHSCRCTKFEKEGEADAVGEHSIL